MSVKVHLHQELALVSVEVAMPSLQCSCLGETLAHTAHIKLQQLPSAKASNTNFMQWRLTCSPRILLGSRRIAQQFDNMRGHQTLQKYLGNCFWGIVRLQLRIHTLLHLVFTQSRSCLHHENHPSVSVLQYVIIKLCIGRPSGWSLAKKNPANDERKTHPSH